MRPADHSPSYELPSGQEQVPRPSGRPPCGTGDARPKQPGAFIHRWAARALQHRRRAAQGAGALGPHHEVGHAGEAVRDPQLCSMVLGRRVCARPSALQHGSRQEGLCAAHTFAAQFLAGGFVRDPQLCSTDLGRRGCAWPTSLQDGSRQEELCAPTLDATQLRVCACERHSCMPQAQP
eukprot:365938-Chlamydomonas_euryale.AAC.11